MIKEINDKELIAATKQYFMLQETDSTIDEAFLACSVRRLAGFQCPCSIRTLVNSVIDAFKYLDGTPESDFRARIEEVIEKLIIGGDLLELSEVSTNDIAVRGTWIFSAHPSYFILQNNTILIFGIVQDELSPISPLADRIVYDGCRRSIIPKFNEDLEQTLNDFGLTKLSESAWLKLPKVQTAQDYLSMMTKKLARAPSSGEIVDLLVTNTAKSNRFYRNRWSEPTNLTGHFVAKRPHVYGGHLWCFVELNKGLLVRFIDIPFKYNGIHQRGCDGGWQLQMALDFCAGKPQVYDVRETNEGDIFEFYSPIPLWAERRLISLGDRVKTLSGLFAYRLPRTETSAQEKFLKTNLWLFRKS